MEGAVLQQLSMPYYMPHSDKRFRNAIESTIHVFCMKKKRFSNLLLNHLHLPEKLTWVMILMSIAFQRYITSPIWAMVAGIQPSIGENSGRTTQAVNCKKRNFNTTREQNPTTNEIPI